MNFRSSISKEELSVFPTEVFRGKIIVVSSEEELEKIIPELEQEAMIGFDTETRPSFKKGGNGNKTALMQLSTQNCCYLLRLNLLGMPDSLVKLLTNENIKKIGISLKDDFHVLRKRRHDFKPDGFIDLQNIAKNYGIEELSLQKMYAIIFEKKISKTQRLSNWEAEELTPAQQQYAAVDAWACLQIYKQFMQIK